MAQGPPIIEVVDLYKSFGSNQVLRGVNLAVEEGSTCVIMGASGSGKTVLMKHLIGLLKPERGQVLVEDEDIVPMGPEQLALVRRKFGMVFQGSALFDSMTVFENVSFPLREHTKMTEAEMRDAVRHRLQIVGLNGIEDKYPADLSGGMRKRVGLARAIVLDPKIVLYDEPTTGLDPITTDYVDQMIIDAKRALGVTSVVISHDVASSFKVGDTIAFLTDGKIVAQLPPKKLRQSQHPAVKLFLSSWFEKYD